MFYQNRDLRLFRVFGPEAVDWFQKISSQKIISGQREQLLHSAFLKAGGEAIAIFNLHRLEDEIRLYVDEESASDVKRHMDFMHFGEKLQITESKVFSVDFHSNILTTEIDVLAELKNYYLQHNEWKQEFSLVLGHAICKQNFSLIFPSEKAMEDFVSSGAVQSFFDFLKTKNNSIKYLEILKQDYAFFKSFFRFPSSKKDLNLNNIILEAGLDEYVSTNKGCYPGQEVIAKVYTYGRVAKFIAFLHCQKDDYVNTEEATKIFSGDQELGVLTSVHDSNEVSKDMKRFLFCDDAYDKKILVFCMKRLALEKHNSGQQKIEWQGKVFSELYVRERDLSLNK